MPCSSFILPWAFGFNLYSNVVQLNSDKILAFNMLFDFSISSIFLLLYSNVGKTYSLISGKKYEYKSKSLSFSKYLILIFSFFKRLNKYSLYLPSLIKNGFMKYVY